MPTPAQETRRGQMASLRQQVWAMAEAFEAGELMPGGGHLQATMDTAWNALVALCLGIDDWLELHDDARSAFAALCATPTTTDGLLGQPPAVSALDQQRHNALAAAAGAGAGERAYAVWFRHTYPTAPQAPAYAWELLLPAHRALWDAIAQAVLHATDDQR